MSDAAPTTEPRVLLRLRPTPWFIVLHRGGWMLGLLLAGWAFWMAASFTDDPRLISAAHRCTFVAGLWIGSLLLVNAIDRACREYVLTETHVKRRSGILRRAEVEVPLDRIQSLTVLRSIRERVFGLGTLAFSTAGSDGFEFTWYMMAKPDAALRTVRQSLDAAMPRASVPPGL